MKTQNKNIIILLVFFLLFICSCSFLIFEINKEYETFSRKSKNVHKTILGKIDNIKIEKGFKKNRELPQTKVSFDEPKKVHVKKTFEKKHQSPTVHVQYNESFPKQIKNDSFKTNRVVVNKKNVYTSQTIENKNEPVKFLCQDQRLCNLKDNGLIVSKGPVGAISYVETNRAYTKGKYYFEAQISFIDTDVRKFLMIEDFGIIQKSFDSKKCFSKSRNPNCNIYGLNFSMQSPQIINDGDVIGFAVDFDNSKIYNALNGKWLVGNPITGESSYTFSSDRTNSYVVFAQTSRNVDWKFNFGAKPFKYNIPTGFKPYSSN